MKKDLGKKTLLAVLLCAALLVGCLAASLTAIAEENETFVSRTLYYVDAGNIVDTNGNKADRGSWGGTSTVVTPTMTERGFAFATQADDKTKLYNSGTDMVFGTDAVSGKSWGYAVYDGHDWWRHGLTGSTVDGYDTVRLIEASDTATLKYTFEVDDDTTFLKIVLGTRMIKGWQPVSFSVKVNGSDKGLVVTGEGESTHVFFTKGMLDSDSGKYFVSIEMGNGSQQTVYCNTLEVATANEQTEGLDTAPYNFVKKGETPRLYKWDGSYVSTTVSDEVRSTIDNAEYFSVVTINCNYGNQTFENVKVTVLPSTLEYFLDVGGAGDGKMMLGDRLYADDPSNNNCGVDEDNKGTDGWQSFSYDQSCRFDVNWNPLKFVFDVDAGAHGVIVGTYHFDNSTPNGRTSYMQLNNDQHVEVNATFGVASHTCAYTVLEESGKLTAAFTANWKYTEQDKQNYPLVTYIAVYKMAAVSFDVDGAEAIDSQAVEIGAKATMPTEPTKEGYTFGGWYVDAEYVTKYNFEATVTSDVTLYAQWNINKYDVTFVVNGGNDVAAQNVEHGNKATKPADPVKENYTFGGWYTDETFDTSFDFDEMITHNVTLYAKWTKNIYTVTFEGADVASQTVEHGNKVTKPADPTKEGYTFDGWFVDDKAYDFDSAVTANITLTAKFTEVKAPEPQNKGCFGVVGASSVAIAVFVGAAAVVFVKKKED